MAASRRGIDGAAVEAKLAERTAARKAKDFARSDAIRDELLAGGVAIMDGPEGTTWKVAG
jgi:cysteinyl-tRNA synthetase